MTDFLTVAAACEIEAAEMLSYELGRQWSSRTDLAKRPAIIAQAEQLLNSATMLRRAASVDRSPKGGDAKQGAIEDESAVAKPDAPIPPPSPSNETGEPE